MTKHKKICVCGVMGKHLCKYEEERLGIDRSRGKEGFSKLSKLNQ